MKRDLEIDNTEIKKDNKFIYLRSISESGGKSHCEIDKRICERKKKLTL